MKESFGRVVGIKNEMFFFENCELIETVFFFKLILGTKRSVCLGLEDCHYPQSVINRQPIVTFLRFLQ